MNSSGARPSTDRPPRGRHGIAPEDVAEDQRWRLLAAVGEVLSTHGYQAARSREVCRRAGVSSATFYQHFQNLDDCLRAAHGVAVDCIWDLVRSACSEPGEWAERLAPALEAVVAFLASEPRFGRLLCADLAAGVPQVQAEREELQQRLCGLLGGCRGRQAGPAELAAGVERQLLGGIFVLLGERVAAGDSDSLPSIAGELTAILARSYTAVT